MENKPWYFRNHWRGILTAFLVLGTVIFWLAGVLILLKPKGQVYQTWDIPIGVGLILLGLTCLILSFILENHYEKLTKKEG